MIYDKDKYKNCTYVFGGVLRPIPKDPLMCGWVKVGGNPDDTNGEWLYRVNARKREGLFGGYDIREDHTYPGDYKTTGRALTLEGARKQVNKRVWELSHKVAKDLNLPVVDLQESLRLDKIADDIAIERMMAKYAKE